MTDETLAELRRGIEILVRAVAFDRDVAFCTCHSLHSVVSSANTFGPFPPLTTAQQLALSVLVGEPDTVIASALADYLIESGHEYAAAVADKARREAVGELVKTAEQVTPETRGNGWFYRAVMQMFAQPPGATPTAV